MKIKEEKCDHRWKITLLCWLWFFLLLLVGSFVALVEKLLVEGLPLYSITATASNNWTLFHIQPTLLIQCTIYLPNHTDLLDNKESVHIYIYIHRFICRIYSFLSSFDQISMVCAVYKIYFISTPKQQNHNLIKLTFYFGLMFDTVRFLIIYIFLLWLEGNFNFNNLISFFIYYRCIFDFFHSSCAFDVNRKSVVFHTVDFSIQ